MAHTCSLLPLCVCIYVPNLGLRLVWLLCLLPVCPFMWIVLLQWFIGILLVFPQLSLLWFQPVHFLAKSTCLRFDLSCSCCFPPSSLPYSPHFCSFPVKTWSVCGSPRTRMGNVQFPPLHSFLFLLAALFIVSCLSDHLTPE